MYRDLSFAGRWYKNPKTGKSEYVKNRAIDVYLSYKGCKEDADRIDAEIKNGNINRMDNWYRDRANEYHKSLEENFPDEFEKIQNWEPIQEGMFGLCFDDIQENIQEIFNRDVTRFDIELIATMAQLLIDLPSSHSYSSVVNTVRGKAKMTKKYAGYGMLDGVKGYPINKVTELAKRMKEHMKILGIYKSCYSEGDCPEWIGSKKVSELEGYMVAQYIQEMAEKLPKEEIVRNVDNSPSIEEMAEKLDKDEIVNLIREESKKQQLQAHIGWNCKVISIMSQKKTKLKNGNTSYNFKFNVGKRVLKKSKWSDDKQDVYMKAFNYKITTDNEGNEISREFKMSSPNSDYCRSYYNISMDGNLSLLDYVRSPSEEERNWTPRPECVRDDKNGWKRYAIK